MVHGFLVLDYWSCSYLKFLRPARADFANFPDTTFAPLWLTSSTFSPACRFVPPKLAFLLEILQIELAILAKKDFRSNPQ
jgi:hypothetical protein